MFQGFLVLASRFVSGVKVSLNSEKTNVSKFDVSGCGSVGHRTHGSDFNFAELEITSVIALFSFCR